MKGIFKGLLVVILASFIAACGNEGKDNKVESAKEHLNDAGQSIKDAGQSLNDASQSLKDAGSDTKDAAKDKAKDDSSNNEAQ